jgi:tetratricopeptide (TPR) repeat protein
MQRSIPKTNSGGEPLVRLVCLLLALITLVLYWPVKDFQFNNYDDAQYLTENPRVQNGITVQAVTWAFTTGYASNWHPLTWLSHILDFQLFGFNAGGHHFTNLLFHVANTLLLFLLLRRWTGALWRSAFVAALFAWHPLHVESVAWVAERKDVLSTCFWLLTLFAYGKYVDESRNAPALRSQEPQASRSCYLLTLVLFALGLLCKPMLVSLPLILLLLDYWPLRRIQLPCSTSDAFSLLREKIPFFLLAVISCGITFLAQKNGNAVQSLEDLPLADRFANALLSYVRYLGKLFRPVDLSIIYPYSRPLPLVEVLAAAILLLGICVVVGRLAKTHPPLLVGWLWFVITLVPVIGLVQVGDQAIADRYTYIPSIGLFLIIAWEVPRLCSAGQESICAMSIQCRIALQLSAAMILSACLLTAAHQLWYWQDSIALFNHAIQVTKNNFVAECDLGLAFATSGQTNEAIRHERAALQINPSYPEAENNLGMLLLGQGKLDEAIPHLLAAIKSRPQSDKAYYNLGLIYLQQGRLDPAGAQFRSATKINPQYDKAFVNLGNVLAKQGRLDEAIHQYLQALAIAPDNPYAHNALGRALETGNKLVEAAAHYSAAIVFKPDFAEARENLGAVLTLQGNFAQAEDQFAQALKLQPASASIHYNLGNALVRQNKVRAAADQYSEAVRLQPDYFDANFNLALALTQLGQTTDAIQHYRTVLRVKPQTVPALQKLAWLLATDPDPQLRNAPEAIRLATQATQLAPDDPSVWDAKAAALAESGQYHEAVAAAGKALGLATARQDDLAKKIQSRLQIYQSGASFHEPVHR